MPNTVGCTSVPWQMSTPPPASDQKKTSDKNEAAAETVSPVEIGGELVKDSVGFAKQVLLTSLLPILLLVGIGSALVGVRALYFYFAPEIINHSHSWVVLFNAVRLDFWYEIERMKLITFALETALHFISLGRFPHDLPKLHVLPFPTMANASGLRHTLKETTVACKGLETGADTLFAWIRSKTSNEVCPLLRAAWPLGAVNTTLQATVSWLAYDANPQANNCAVNDYDEQMARSCLVINFGFVLLELALPALIIVFLTKHFRRSLLLLLGALWTALRRIFSGASKAASKIV